MYVYAGFSEKISQLSNLTVHHSQTTGQLIWKNDLIAIKKKPAFKRGLLKYLHPNSVRTRAELSQQDFAMGCLAV